MGKEVDSYFNKQRYRYVESMSANPDIDIKYEYQPINKQGSVYLAAFWLAVRTLASHT